MSDLNEEYTKLWNKRHSLKFDIDKLNDKLAHVERRMLEIKAIWEGKK